MTGTKTVIAVFEREQIEAFVQSFKPFVSDSSIDICETVSGVSAYITTPRHTELVKKLKVARIAAQIKPVIEDGVQVAKGMSEVLGDLVRRLEGINANVDRVQKMGKLTSVFAEGIPKEGVRLDQEATYQGKEGFEFEVGQNGELLYGDTEIRQACAEPQFCFRGSGEGFADCGSLFASETECLANEQAVSSAISQAKANAAEEAMRHIESCSRDFECPEPCILVPRITLYEPHPVAPALGTAAAGPLVDVGVSGFTPGISTSLREWRRNVVAIVGYDADMLCLQQIEFPPHITEEGIGLGAVFNEDLGGDCPKRYAIGASRKHFVLSRQRGTEDWNPPQDQWKEIKARRLPKMQAVARAAAASEAGGAFSSMPCPYRCPRPENSITIGPLRDFQKTLFAPQGRDQYVFVDCLWTARKICSK